MKIKQIKNIVQSSLLPLLFIFVLICLFVVIKNYTEDVSSRESFIPMINRAQNRASRNIRLTTETIREKFNNFLKKTKKTVVKASGIAPYLK